jgi:hypothetical protein
MARRARLAQFLVEAGIFRFVDPTGDARFRGINERLVDAVAATIEIVATIAPFRLARGRWMWQQRPACDR